MNNEKLKLFIGDAEHKYVYTDHPYRENVNNIDQLLMRAKEYACSENLKFYTINQYVSLVRCRRKKRNRFPKASSKR